MLKKIFCVIWLTVLLPGVCIAGGINVKSLDRQNWVNIETANFNVLTNAKEENALEIVRELEDFKYFLAGLLGYEQRDLSEKVSVVVAKNQKIFSAMGVPNNYAGVFVSNYGYAILARGDKFRSSSEGGSSWGRSVVFHELVHLFLRNAILDFSLPIWFEEGAAEYFGTYVEKKDRVIIGSLRYLENRFNSLRDVDGKFERVDSESLFRLSQSELNIGAGNSSRQKEFIEKFYARASLVVHYMYADPGRMMQMYQYLHLLKKGVAIDEAFNQAFQMTWEELDVDVNRYISKWSMTGLAVRIGEGGVSFPEVTYKKNDISKQEAMGFLYARISMLSEDFLGEGTHRLLYSGLDELYPGLADTMIQKQLSQDPENAGLLMRTARTYEKVEKYGNAMALYERALLAGASDPGVLNGFAWFLATVPDMAFRDPQRAISLAETAAGIRRSPAILDTLAEAHYASGAFQRAIEIINEAIALDPEYAYLKEQLEKFIAALAAAA